MSLSKIRFCILSIIVFFTLFEGVLLTKYQKISLAQLSKNNQIKMQLEDEKVFLTNEEQETLDLINKYRKKQNLEELKPLACLQNIAKIKAEDLVQNYYFSHTSANLGTPFEMLESNGVYYKIAGENLAGNANPQKAVEAWINSKEHRDNILEQNFNYTGICVIDSPIYGKVFVQLFIGI
mgnify:FL=1